jgi:hypothetical protein
MLIINELIFKGVICTVKNSQSIVSLARAVFAINVHFGKVLIQAICFR